MEAADHALLKDAAFVRDAGRRPDLLAVHCENTGTFIERVFGARSPAVS